MKYDKVPTKRFVISRGLIIFDDNVRKWIIDRTRYVVWIRVIRKEYDIMLPVGDYSTWQDALQAMKQVPRDGSDTHIRGLFGKPRRSRVTNGSGTYAAKAHRA